jgi:hypothetical protein
LHLRSEKVIEGEQYDEVSLGYPQQWSRSKSLADYLRRLI